MRVLCIYKHSPIHHSYYLNNIPLQSVSSAKYLGVIVDVKLSWNKCVSYISSKATRTLNFLRCNMYFCDAPAKNKAFRTLVLPVLVQCRISTHIKTFLLSHMQCNTINFMYSCTKLVRSQNCVSEVTRYARCLGSTQ